MTDTFNHLAFADYQDEHFTKNEWVPFDKDACTFNEETNTHVHEGLKSNDVFITFDKEGKVLVETFGSIIGKGKFIVPEVSFKTNTDGPWVLNREDFDISILGVLKVDQISLSTMGSGEKTALTVILQTPKEGSGDVKIRSKGLLNKTAGFLMDKQDILKAYYKEGMITWPEVILCKYLEGKLVKTSQEEIARAFAEEHNETEQLLIERFKDAANHVTEA